MIRLVVVAALLLSACATPRVDHASSGDESGYAERRIGLVTWRLEYRGENADSVHAVERHMLRRAAELTLASGFEWFVQTESSATTENEIVVEGVAPRVSQGAVWRPRWRQRSLSRWTDWEPRGAPPQAEPPPRSFEIERVIASADIVMGCSTPPSGAYHARAVLAELRE